MKYQAFEILLEGKDYYDVVAVWFGDTIEEVQAEAEGVYQWVEEDDKVIGNISADSYVLITENNGRGEQELMEMMKLEL